MSSQNAYLAFDAPIRPLKRSEYDRLVQSGAFEGEKLELLRGAIVEMSPQGTPHSRTILLLTHVLVARCGQTHWLRVQLPFAASDASEPEPDFALVRRDTSLDEHPSHADLVVEVAESSLRLDRGLKAELYAEAGVPMYWVVNLVSGVVEVHTNPVDGRYTKVDVVRPGESIDVLGHPVDPADFLR